MTLLNTDLVSSPGLSARVVVLVDDDSLPRCALSNLLEDAGYRTVAFSDGPSALSYLRKGGAADAVFLDWSMPRMDGAEVLRRIRADGHSVPVLFLTGYTEQMIEETALSHGATDFLPKTKSVGILLHRLQLAINRGKAPEPVVAAGSPGLAIDDECARLAWNGRGVPLTLSEFKVVRLLLSRPNRCVSYREIYDVVRGEGFLAGHGEHGYRTSVRATIKRIRGKFAAVDPTFDAIGNSTGLGYCWKDFITRQ